jgi:hypothetical protein
MKKTLPFDYYNLLLQSRCETRSLYGTFVEISKFRFLMHSFQDPPLCISTANFLLSVSPGLGFLDEPYSAKPA